MRTPVFLWIESVDINKKKRLFKKELYGFVGEDHRIILTSMFDYFSFKTFKVLFQQPP
jgi:hypothetical protein